MSPPRKDTGGSAPPFRLRISIVERPRDVDQTTRVTLRANMGVHDPFLFIYFSLFDTRTFFLLCLVLRQLHAFQGPVSDLRVELSAHLRLQVIERKFARCPRHLRRFVTVLEELNRAIQEPQSQPEAGKRLRVRQCRRPQVQRTLARL